MERQQMEQNPERESWNVFWWMLFVCRSLAFSLEALLHRRMGPRFAGLHGPAALLFIVLFGVLWAGYDLLGLLEFAGVYLLAVAIERAHGLWCGRSRSRIHSRYSGESVLTRLFPRWPESMVKRVVEPLLAFVVGMAIYTTDQPLGSYIMVAAAALAFKVNLDAAYNRARAFELVDASIESELLAARFREMRGDLF